jgi:hypothetical protein
MNLIRLGRNCYQVQIPSSYLTSRIMPSKPTPTGFGTPAPEISAQHPDMSA